MSNPSLEEVRNRLEPAGPDVLDGHESVEIVESVEPSDTELGASRTSGSQLPAGNRSSARSMKTESVKPPQDSHTTGFEASNSTTPTAGVLTRSRDPSPLKALKPATTPKSGLKIGNLTPATLARDRTPSPYGLRSQSRIHASLISTPDIQASNDPNLTQPTQIVESIASQFDAENMDVAESDNSEEEGEEVPDLIPAELTGPTQL